MQGLVNDEMVKHRREIERLTMENSDLKAANEKLASDMEAVMVAVSFIRGALSEKAVIAFIFSF